MSKAGLFLFLFAMSPGLFAQDICRDEFVSCVATSGDILACRSVYTNCEASQGNDLLANNGPSAAALSENTGQLKLNPVIQEAGGGLSSVRLLLSNPTEQPIQVGNATYPVRCADGSMDRAVFFMDFLLDAGVQNQAAAGDQLVCIGAGGAVTIDNENAQIAGMASVSSSLDYEFPCANGEYRWIALEYTSQGVYRWSNSQNYRGTINQAFVREQQFLELACTPLDPGEPELVNEARRKLIEWMGNPSPGKLIYNRNEALGVRG